MKEKELRELDAFIAEHVMGWIYHQEKPCRKGVDTSAFGMWNCGSTSRLANEWRPTTDRAASQEVLEKCIVKCDAQIAASIHPKMEVMVWCEGFGIEVTAETLPLAICFFAQKLFSK